MSHVRAQIREYVRAKLIAIPGLEQSVEIDSEKIPEAPIAPHVYVMLGGETASTSGMSSQVGRKLARELELLVDIYCRAQHEPLLKAEEYAAAIEAKLAADPRMGRLASDLSLRAYQIETSTAGSQPLSRLRMQFAVTYFTNERDATVPA